MKIFTSQKLIALLLLAVGVELWLVLGRGGHGLLGNGWRNIPVFVTLAIVLLPPIARRIYAISNRLATPSPRTRAIITLLIWPIATAYFLLTAFQFHRDLFPKLHDEFMHLLQMRMLAHGHLWYPQHELADFFESFHIFVKPIYASIYFPGTALMYLPVVWLNIPYWIATALVAGAAVAMSYRVIAEILDGFSALLACFMLIAMTGLRYLSMMVMSHSVMLLLGLMLIWAWLRWREKQTLLWAAIIGAIAGWAAITRPVDALCYAIPIGVAMIVSLSKTSPRHALQTCVIVLAASAPFLTLQLIFNRVVTGNWVETPYHRYAELFTPQMSFGFHQFNPNIRPQTELPQRIKYYDEYTVESAQQHRPSMIFRTWVRDRLPLISELILPTHLLWLLIAVSVLQMRGPRVALVATLLIYIAAYSMFAYLLRHYLIVIAPSVILLVLMGMRALENTFPRAAAYIVSGCSAILLVTSLYALPQLNRFIDDDPFIRPTLRFNQDLPKHIEPGAIVLYHFAPEDNPHEEPVYNLDVVNPDDAPIIRAQDLGPRNVELFRYYAKRQPQRQVYLFDRELQKLQPLGRVTDLAN